MALLPGQAARGIQPDLRRAFGVTPGAHSRLKKLHKVKTGNNLRDHMTDLELIFTMLGEASTTEIARNKDAMGYDGNLNAAIEGGTVAGNARQDLERKSGRRVSTRENFKEIPEAVARKTIEKQQREIDDEKTRK